MAEMIGTIASWTASDGYQGYYRLYLPPGSPQGSIVCLHGIQSHGGWYEYSCRQLAEAGYVVAFLDRRGSGLNFAHRGDTPSFQRLFQDVAEFIDHITKRFPETQGKVTLSACSWGGKVAVGMCRDYGNLFQRMILICPGFFPQVGVPLPTKLKIGRSKALRPTRGFDIPLNDPALFTTSEQWRTFLRNDPLALHQATARFLVESRRLDRYCLTAPAAVTMPVLLQLAGQDRIIRNEPTKEYVNSFATQAKRILEYPEAHHTLEFEPDPKSILQDQIMWLTSKGPH